MAKVIVLYDDPPEDAAMDAMDVLLQVGAVSDTLNRMGFEVLKLAFSPEDDFSDKLRALNPSFVFNLVESVFSKNELNFMAPALLDKLNIRFTGCRAHAMRMTTDKLTAKKRLRLFGVSTPGWVAAQDTAGFVSGERYIVKPRLEDASVGLGPESVMPFDRLGQVKAYLKHAQANTGREFFAERYIEGREFSLPMLGEGGKPVVVAPYEICFRGFEERNLIKIFDYRAKWEKDSFEYQNILHSGDFLPVDEALLCKMRAQAEKCWEIFSLGGYARVDFRVDAEGTPWVLEVNANPCITLGDSGGFLETAEKAGISYTEIINKIVGESYRGDADYDKERCRLS